MARVAAAGGDMTNSERVYFDSILPFGRYPETYRLCCTDLLKWDSRCNPTATNRISRNVGSLCWLETLLCISNYGSIRLSVSGPLINPMCIKKTILGVPKNNTSPMEDCGIDGVYF